MILALTLMAIVDHCLVLRSRFLFDDMNITESKEEIIYYYLIIVLFIYVKI